MTDRPMTPSDVQHVNPLWRVMHDDRRHQFCADYQGMAVREPHVCAASPDELHQEILAADTRRPPPLPRRTPGTSGHVPAGTPLTDRAREAVDARFHRFWWESMAH